MSTVPDGLYQYGGLPVGVGYFPAIPKDAKVFFVDPANGSDYSDGLTPESPLDTVAAAYAKTVDKRGDIVFLMSDGGTTGTARDKAIVWANSNTHLIGVTAPGINRRARISPPSTDAADVDAYTPYITLSGSGCIFANFSLFQGQTEDSKASVGIYVSGSRNYLNNVDVITGAHANQGDEAGTYNLQVLGSENVFESCYIGQDTVMRSAANANVRFGDGTGTGDQASRNVFKNCIFVMCADETTPVFIQTGHIYDSGRWELFKDCTFINTGSAYAGGDTIAAGVSWHADTNGWCLLQNCGFVGCTDVTAADSTKVFAQGPASGVAVEVGMFKGIDIAA